MEDVGVTLAPLASSHDATFPSHVLVILISDKVVFLGEIFGQFAIF